MPQYEIKNKVVAITGATSGIGEACARSFAEAGAKVAVIGRNAAKVEKVVSAVRSIPGGVAEGFVLDLSDLAQIPKVAAQIQAKFGGIDVLVNNAAYAVGGLAEETPVEQYKKNFEVNFFAPLALIQAVIPGMKKRRSGQIINVSSGVGRRALPGFSSYCTTKFALNGLSESLRLELAPWNIDVISIFPGRVDSNFHDNVEFYGQWKRPIVKSSMKSSEALGRFILDASIHRKREATVFGPGKIGYHINYWAPRLVDKILARKYPIS